MKHDRRQHRIELTVGKGQRFDDGIIEDNFRTSFAGLLTCPGQHLWRRVNPIDSAGRANTSLGGDGECASPAADVQNRIAWFQAC